MQGIQLAFRALMVCGVMAGTVAKADGVFYPAHSGPVYGSYPLVGGTVYTPVPYGSVYGVPTTTYYGGSSGVVQVTNQEIVPTPAGTVTTQTTTVASNPLAPVPVTTTIVSPGAPVYVAPTPVYSAPYPVYVTPSPVLVPAYVRSPLVYYAPRRGVMRIRY
jgi:hypothetical protein